MRTTVLMPVEKVLCDAHLAKDGSEVEATSALTLGRHSWDLCLEHDVSFGRYLWDALGAPAEPESLPVVEPVSEPEREAVPVVEPDPEPVPSVMLAGEVPGYSWEDAREAVRRMGYEVVGRADDSTILLILGEGGDRNATKLRDASERGIPVMDVREPGRFKSAVISGELVGGDPLPEPAKVDRSGMSERERNRAVRAWARENGFTVPTKGRIPMHVRHAWEHRDASEGKAAAA
ncbi:Lsr2 family DNA-binding protein [Streptomyces gibsoniae]|uniref:Histone-like nucleoid-structuring protein Lsr2 n=1 Tax=Streptomyces gibsoniae TaxID=3075529 RepID=A0ABU2U4Y5_9ACTN|nr:histone-like nucleoid-structuring protein Lsr2 [Streptomyces sp. DSM 41699]MDT0468291.1 histone-like nucleoid-structuring protein Lsr2 [Streptomyces sp. DSM 41699]